MSDDPAAWIFLGIWTVMWLLIPFLPAPRWRWAERFMARLARRFDRLWTWYIWPFIAVKPLRGKEKFW